MYLNSYIGIQVTISILSLVLSKPREETVSKLISFQIRLDVTTIYTSMTTYIGFLVTYYHFFFQFCYEHLSILIHKRCLALQLSWLAIEVDHSGIQIRIQNKKDRMTALTSADNYQISDIQRQDLLISIDGKEIVLNNLQHSMILPLKSVHCIEQLSQILRQSLSRLLVPQSSPRTIVTCMDMRYVSNYILSPI
jgi:hypothetical protein